MSTTLPSKHIEWFIVLNFIEQVHIMIIQLRHRVELLHKYHCIRNILHDPSHHLLELAIWPFNPPHGFTELVISALLARVVQIFILRVITIEQQHIRVEVLCPRFLLSCHSGLNTCDVLLNFREIVKVLRKGQHKRDVRLEYCRRRHKW